MCPAFMTIPFALPYWPKCIPKILISHEGLTAINGVPITGWNHLSEYLELNTQVGDTVTLSILRGTQSLELDLTLAAQP